VREQPGEVPPGRQRGGPDPLEDPVLPAGRELPVTRAERAQGGDRRHVVLQRREPAEVGALPEAAEQRPHDNHEHHREHEREDGALRVTPERQLLAGDLVDHQGQVVAAARRAVGRSSSHQGLLSFGPNGTSSRVSRRYTSSRLGRSTVSPDSTTSCRTAQPVSRCSSAVGWAVSMTTEPSFGVPGTGRSASATPGGSVKVMRACSASTPGPGRPAAPRPPPRRC